MRGSSAAANAYQRARRAKGRNRHGTVDIVRADAVDEVLAHAMDGKDLLGHDGTGEHGCDGERHAHGRGNQRAAQRMLADGLLAGQPLGAGGAHIVGIHLIEQIGALPEVVAHGADDREDDRGQEHMLTEVNESLDGVRTGVARKTRHVEELHARGVVDPNGHEHDKDGQHHGGDDHEQRGDAAKEPVLPLILPLGRIYAQSHSNDDGKDRGDRQKLHRSPDAAGDRAVDRIAHGRQAPIPFEDHVVQPVAITFEHRGLIVDVRFVERSFNGLLRGSRRTRLVIGAGIHESARKEVRQRRSDENHRYVAEDALAQVPKKTSHDVLSDCSAIPNTSIAAGGVLGFVDFTLVKWHNGTKLTTVHFVNSPVINRK